MPKRAHIVYGFSESRLHGRRFIKALRKQNIRLTRTFDRADYIIAHSGGCFNVPELRKNQLLMLIDPPYWPGQTLRSRAVEMTKQVLSAMRPGNRPLLEFYKNILRVGHVIIMNPVNRRIARQAKSFNLEDAVHHTHTILIRNANDPWITPDLTHLQQINPNLVIVTMPSGHDHCWDYPDAYVNLLKRYTI